MRIGILFGGNSREREVSFAGGRTVYDNLDKSLFDPLPLFIDSFGRFILLQWEYIYKGSIRDFYPPARHLPDMDDGFQIYAESLNPTAAEAEEMASSIGTIVPMDALPGIIDFAFLALHGTGGEDGSVQGVLEWLGIPYSGSGIFPSSLGMNKALQKDFQERAGLYINRYFTIKRQTWLSADEEERQDLFRQYNITFQEKFVIKPANQGSSLGVSVLHHPDYETFIRAMDQAFFRISLESSFWLGMERETQVQWIKQITDLRSGLGLPLRANGHLIYRPDAFMQWLNTECRQNEEVLLEAEDGETEVVIEEFLSGKEFSCIVIRDDYGKPIALPPTEIRKSTPLFDYRSKYLPGLSHKVTPIEVEDEYLANIREACTHLYDYFGFNVYARIDGFVDDEGEVYLNDPNTTSGMMPSSFFFHQAAEIGLNPSQFLTYIIRNSLAERTETGTRRNNALELLSRLDAKVDALQSGHSARRRVAVIMGGYSYERHISMESGRNIYEKLSSSEEFHPIPVFLTGSADHLELFLLPLNLMLKDNADDIRDKVRDYHPHPVLREIMDEAAAVTGRYNLTGTVLEPRRISMEELAGLCEGVFIALHGRPGEDGTLQTELRRHGLYYNGSEAHSSAITINKFETNEKLRAAGFLVADHQMLSRQNWESDKEAAEAAIIARFGLPLIAKPADDGCSAAVRKVKSPGELHHFLSAIFRDEPVAPAALREPLGIGANEELPLKQELLIEKFIDKGNSARFMEVTGGMLTHKMPDGTLRYEIFEPSESLAESEILSLEEKFLAGQGQNITPSRFSRDPKEQARISAEVRNTLEKVARALDVTGYCRIDAFVKIFDDGRVETWIIEINSLPGMTPATCIYHQAALNGYKPFDFIREILNFGRQNQSLNA
ncbi:MAG: D-alanine--D-alanine ligase [Bacteroidetes bacterium]|nr:D-alanine--D-alanine ligase [Bacteroidota bacterium]